MCMRHCTIKEFLSEKKTKQNKTNKDKTRKRDQQGRAPFKDNGVLAITVS